MSESERVSSNRFDFSNARVRKSDRIHVDIDPVERHLLQLRTRKRLDTASITAI